MINQLISLYNIFETKKSEFTASGLIGDWFIDAYRGQPLEPELFEYYSLPAIFIDYKMTGQGKGKPRLITLTAHIVTDHSADIANISLNLDEGMKRFAYLGKVQKILEGTPLHNTTPLKFISEEPIDTGVVEYHAQVYEFEAYLDDIYTSPTETQTGMIELLRLQGRLQSK